ncbi:MAG: NnrU family protein [Alcanivoracaceae bacterium]
MLALVAGLLLFLGAHSLAIALPEKRAALIRQWGEQKWKALVGIVSIAGFVLLVWGYGQARMEPVWLWQSPVWTRHLAALLMLPSMILLVATYVPGTHIKARIGHPMLLATKIWALAHLFANGTLADLLLFGSFLGWAVLGFIIHRRRDRAAGTTYPAVSASRDAIAVVVGLVLYGAFVGKLHVLLMGVSPFGT